MPWEGTDPIKWAAAASDVPPDAIKIFAFAVFSRVVMRTPVDTGAARQNWLVTINEETDKYDPSKGKGGKVMSEGGKVIESAKGDETLYIQNNAPYIGMLEYGGYSKKPETEKTVGGFSKQAPHGMVGVTLAKADTLWDAAVKAAKGNQ